MNSPGGCKSEIQLYFTIQNHHVCTLSDWPLTFLSKETIGNSNLRIHAHVSAAGRRCGAAAASSQCFYATQ